MYLPGWLSLLSSAATSPLITVVAPKSGSLRVVDAATSRGAGHHLRVRRGCRAVKTERNSSWEHLMGLFPVPGSLRHAGRHGRWLGSAGEEFRHDRRCGFGVNVVSLAGKDR